VEVATSLRQECPREPLCTHDIGVALCGHADEANEESEGSRPQTAEPRNTNLIRGGSAVANKLIVSPERESCGFIIFPSEFVLAGRILIKDTEANSSHEGLGSTSARKRK